MVGETADTPKDMEKRRSSDWDRSWKRTENQWGVWGTPPRWKDETSQWEKSAEDEEEYEEQEAANHSKKRSWEETQGWQGSRYWSHDWSRPKETSRSWSPCRSWGSEEESEDEWHKTGRWGTAGQRRWAKSASDTQGWYYEEPWPKQESWREKEAVSWPSPSAQVWEREEPPATRDAPASSAGEPRPPSVPPPGHVLEPKAKKAPQQAAPKKATQPPPKLQPKPKRTLAPMKASGPPKSPPPEVETLEQALAVAVKQAGGIGSSSSTESVLEVEGCKTVLKRWMEAGDEEARLVLETLSAMREEELMEAEPLGDTPEEKGEKRKIRFRAGRKVQARRLRELLQKFAAEADQK